MVTPSTSSREPRARSGNGGLCSSSNPSAASPETCSSPRRRLGVDRARLEGALRTLGVPSWRLDVQRRSASAILGTHVDVVVEGQEPLARSSLILGVDASVGSPRAKASARALFERIGRADGVHGIPVEEVHFHEVGAVDSIVDVGVAVVLDLLGWPRVVSAPPAFGRGSRAPRTAPCRSRRRPCWSSSPGSQCGRAARPVRR